MPVDNSQLEPRLLQYLRISLCFRGELEVFGCDSVVSNLHLSPPEIVVGMAEPGFLTERRLDQLLCPRAIIPLHREYAQFVSRQDIVRIDLQFLKKRRLSLLWFPCIAIFRSEFFMESSLPRYELDGSFVFC